VLGRGIHVCPFFIPFVDVLVVFYLPMSTDILFFSIFLSSPDQEYIFSLSTGYVL
jgi:hypothetical protein